MKKILLAAAVSMVAATSAFAQSAPVAYVGLAAGGTHVTSDDCSDGVSCDKSNTGYKLYGGYKLTDNIAVETHYADFGKIRAHSANNGVTADGDIKLSGFGVGVAFLGDLTDTWTGVVRAGVARNKAKGDAFASNGARISESHSSTSGYIGGGIGYKLNKEVTLTAAVDYTQGKLSGDKVKATLYSLGASYSF